MLLPPCSSDAFVQQWVRQGRMYMISKHLTIQGEARIQAYTLADEEDEEGDDPQCAVLFGETKGLAWYVITTLLLFLLYPSMRLTRRRSNGPE